MNRILTCVLAAMLLAASAEAQVSVRRTSKKEKETKSQTASKPATAGKSGKGETAQTTAPAPTSANNAAIARKTTPTKRNQQTATVNASGKTLRQQAFDAYQKDEASETPWQHIVYRELDLNKDVNASLYFPAEPQDGMTNLFRVIIDAFAKGELPAYEYLDGREVFTEKYRVKQQDIFDKFEIYYQVKSATQRGGQDTYEIDESDVPSAEVKSYYIKERWEFDQKHSKYQARILCICPVLHRRGDTGADAVKYPMFWLNYEDLRPFLRDHMIVSQGMNTAARYTMEEFFTLGQYEGTIYKEQDLRGLTLSQQYPNADTLKMKQQELDEELRAFEDSIWVKDPAPVLADRRTKKAKTAEQTAQTEVSAVATDASASAGSATEASSDSSAEVGSKKNRRTKKEVDMKAAAAEKEKKATTNRSVRRSR
ncbi:MAG: gliding motility protein GldN [Bacteroidales bacterium]|nr:gliding motility protein GldN [Bacteroidales bacterium]